MVLIKFCSRKYKKKINTRGMARRNLRFDALASAGVDNAILLVTKRVNRVLSGCFHSLGEDRQKTDSSNKQGAEE